MSTIYLSFDQADSKYVSRLSFYLRRAGVPVWDRDSVPVGERPDEFVAEQINRCTAMVVVMSEASLRSDMVANDIAYAQQHGRIIKPLLLSGDPFASLARLSWIDVRRGNLPGQGFLRELGAKPKRRRIRLPDLRLPKDVVLDLMWCLGNGITALILWEQHSPMWMFVGAMVASVAFGILARDSFGGLTQVLCGLFGLIAIGILVTVLAGRLFIDGAPAGCLAPLLAVGGILGTAKATLNLLSVSEGSGLK